MINANAGKVRGAVDWIERNTRKGANLALILPKVILRLIIRNDE